VPSKLRVMIDFLVSITRLSACAPGTQPAGNAAARRRKPNGEAVG